MESILSLETKNYILLSLDSTRAYDIYSYFKRNRDFFKYAVFDERRDFYTVEYHTNKLLMEEEIAEYEDGFRVWIFSKDDVYQANLIGDICVYDVIRYNQMKCSLGYKLDKDYVKKGIMTECVPVVLEYLRSKYKMKRIEMYIKSDNFNSQSLAKRIGAEKEGTLRQYMKFDGEWFDYDLYSIINVDNN